MNADCTFSFFRRFQTSSFLASFFVFALQICQFCYNKLLRDDPRCPGCRRNYDAASVVFQPVDFDEWVASLFKL